MSQRAVFLDRDNTIIADPGYIDDPDLVELLPGAAEAIKELNDAGFAVVVVTNQSGIARGRFTEEQLDAIHERLRELLSEHGAHLDEIYHCPYLEGEEATVEAYRKASKLRKPKPGMLHLAAKEMHLDLTASWMIGDSARDVVAGTEAGCRTILLRSAEAGGVGESCKPHLVAASLLEAVRLVIADANTGGRLPLSALTLAAASRKPVSPGAKERTVSPMFRMDDPEQSADNAGNVSNQPEADAASSDVLREIRDSVRRMERRHRHEDFSVSKLGGTLAQMLAIVSAGWGLMVLFEDPVVAGARFMLAAFLQLAALTAFTMDRRG